MLYLNRIEMNKFMIPMTFEAITSFSQDDSTILCSPSYIFTFKIRHIKIIYLPFTLIGVMCVMVTGSMVMVTCLRGPMLEEDASDGES